MRRLKFILPFAAAALTLAIVTAASARPAHQVTAAKSQKVSCHGKLKIAMVTPLTGGAGFLGNEQLSWAKYAIKTLPRKYGFNISLVTGDTPVEAGGAPAQALAQKYIADPSVVAILGPSTSGAVAASSAAYFAAGLVLPPAAVPGTLPGEHRADADAGSGRLPSLRQPREQGVRG